MRRVFFVLLWVGCASSPPPRPPEEKPPITIAVIEFGDGGAEAEKGCVQAVLEAGFRAVERPRIDAALPSDDDIDYHKLGKLLGADLIIDAGIPRGGAPKTTPPPRLVATRSSDVLAISKSKARADRGFKVGQKICADLLNQLP